MPCVDHVLWFCPGHADLRKVPRPPGELAARLGWDGSLATEVQQIKVVKERLLAAGAGRLLPEGFLSGPADPLGLGPSPPPAFPLCC